MHGLFVSKGGIAWDWINEKLYWTDFCTGVIEVYDPNSGHRRVLLRARARDRRQGRLRAHGLRQEGAGPRLALHRRLALHGRCRRQGPAERQAGRRMGHPGRRLPPGRRQRDPRRGDQRSGRQVCAT